MIDKIFNLRTENLIEPIGIDARVPRLSWQAALSGRGAKQKAYRILLSSSLQNALTENADILDTGFIESSAFYHDCAGAALKSRKEYFWSVQIINQADDIIKSEVSRFETAFYEESLWQGRYIGLAIASNGVVQFRRRERLKRDIVKARVYLAAAGFAELWLNGKRITQNVLEPANSDYNKHVYYNTYDVTEYLLPGRDNAFGVRLSGGWAGHGRFLFQAYINYADGSEQSVCSEFGPWQACLSEITLATLYAGEYVNPIYEMPEWNLPSHQFEEKYPLMPLGFSSFNQPEKLEDMNERFREYYKARYQAMELPAPGGKIMAQPLEPIRVLNEVRPVSVKRLGESGDYIFDFGQNFTGVCKLKVKGEEGHKITIEHTELLNEDGTPNMLYLRIAEPNYPFPMQTDIYFLRGSGEFEELMPRFTYHGFRFAVVRNMPYEPSLDDLTGYEVRSDVADIGRFNSDSDMLNWMQKAIMWTEKGNLHGIPTDCPQRAERQGWLNDMTARSEGAVYNLDLQLLYKKWARDITDTQEPVSGAIGDTAPMRRGNMPADAVVSSYLLVPYLIYQHYGDMRAIEENYSGMKGWTDYLLRNSNDGIAVYSLYGDWAGPDTKAFCKGSPVSYITPGYFFSSGFNYMNCRLMAYFARILGKEEDERSYLDRAQTVARSMNERFFNEETANYATGSQGCNVFALKLGIVPEKYAQRVADNIAADIIKEDYHLTTGNIATKYLPEVLSEYGYSDIAMRLMEQTTYPSWGYMRKMGATTIWERWEYATGFAMNSHSHPMYGSVTAWFYKYLAGISAVEPGFKRIRIRPYMPEGLNRAEGEINTPYGVVLSGWEKSDKGYTLKINVPASCEAEVILPGGARMTLREGNTALEKARGILKAEAVSGDMRLCLVSGEYIFTAEK